MNYYVMNYYVNYDETLNEYKLTINGCIHQYFKTKENLVNFLKKANFPNIEIALKNLKN